MTNHADLIKSMKSKSNAALRFIVADCTAAIEANPDGHKAGHYADERAYAARELRARNIADQAADSISELQDSIRGMTEDLALARTEPGKAAVRAAIQDAERMIACLSSGQPHLFA